MAAEYEVMLKLNGVTIGNVRRLAQNLTWTRKRTSRGADSIAFSLNDRKFLEWLDGRTQSSVDEVLRPYALECIIYRNREPMVGGYLATKPGYSPNGTSATLALHFEGFLNYLAGVYIAPTPAETMPMQEMLEKYISMAEKRAERAGKGFGLQLGEVDELEDVTQTFESYKSVKEFITDRCDNTSGAGQFEVYFHEDKTYDIIADANFGRVRDYRIQYPTRPSGVSALSISAGEVSGFASHIIGIGEGSTAAESEDATALTSELTKWAAVRNYGYVEKLVQESSISVQETLDEKVQTELAGTIDPAWEPSLTLSGVQVAPSPEIGMNIWVGDTVVIKNDEDLLGATNGKFRVMELSVAVSQTNAETITPVLERIAESSGTFTGIDDLTYMQDFATLTPEEFGIVKTSMTEEQAYSLQDKRDGMVYRVAKLKDGKIWMTDSLNLEGGRVLTSADSDVPDDKPYTMPVTTQLGTAGVNNTDANAEVAIKGKDVMYYSWSTAAAGTQPEVGQADYSLMPKGWTLPSADDFKTLLVHYPTPESLTGAEGPGFGLNGWLAAGSAEKSTINAEGTGIANWASTVTEDNSPTLLIHLGGGSKDDTYQVRPQSSINRFFDIRGVVREPEGDKSGE